jgi:G3E family GTPase
MIADVPKTVGNVPEVFMKNKLILIGGFLGAGKTTFLHETAERLRTEGIRAGLITNDQAADLVDTALLKSSGFPVEEVSGSCFCCNFNGFIDAVRALSAELPGGVILAEPVGSCTDLSATILQPLKEKYGCELDIAPFTVLADPYRIAELIADGMTDDNYIVAKQLEEADLILLNKTDLLSPPAAENLLDEMRKKWPSAEIRAVSAKTGEGIDAWLERIRSDSRAGTHLTDVNYDIYAAGEAAFGWVNAVFELRSPTPDLPVLAQEFLNTLAALFLEKKIPVGHVKFLLKMKEQNIAGNIVGLQAHKDLRVLSGKNDDVTLTVNGRAGTDPETLKKILMGTAARTFESCGIRTVSVKALVPGRPAPTYRYGNVIDNPV